MTYDLTLRPRSGDLDADALVDYFDDHGDWMVDDEDEDHVRYENPSTGVYFDAYLDRDDGALVFSLNFFRSRPFVLEADLELTALVEAFDLAVEDPQEQGIEGDRYDSEQLVRGWELGNAFAYRTALADIEASPRTYDGEALEDIWRWNYNREFTAEENGGHYDVPVVWFAEHEGVVHSIFGYPLGRNLLVPRTDLVAIEQGERTVVVPWRVVEEALALTDGDKIDDPLDYWAQLATLTDRPLAKLLTERSLPIEQLAFDDVHALDDVEAAST